MIKEKFYDFEAISYVDYEFDLCEQKDEFLKILTTSTPTKVNKFNSKGTEWDFGDFDNFYSFVVNKGQIYISTITESIEGLLDFLVKIAYYDNKNLILSIHDEGSYSAVTALATGKNEIRFTVFDYGLMNHKKILSDIIIDKKVLISQFCEILNNLYKDISKETGKRQEYSKNRIKKYIDILSQYLEDEEKFKKEYDIDPYIRVFDIAYKDLNGIWKFDLCFIDDEKADPEYWKKLKQEGKILDYDYTEQDAAHGTREDILEHNKPDMHIRVEDNNWVYSTITKNWYSTNEEMPEPKQKCKIIHSNLKYDVKIDLNSSDDNEDKEIEGFIRQTFNKDDELNSDKYYWGYLPCVLTIKSNNIAVCDIKFDYRNFTEMREALEKSKRGEYVRFDLGGYNPTKLHIWHENNEADKRIAIAGYEHEEVLDFTKDKQVYYHLFDYDFINCFNFALNDIEKKVNTMRHCLKVAEKLKIENKFSIEKDKFFNKIEYLENFVGDYACVYRSRLDGWGVINKNLEWVIKPESDTITGNVHPKWGVEIKGFVTKYTYLHNIDGKLFIASRNYGEQFVMDINGDLKIPHVAKQIDYQYLNDKLYFIARNEDRTLFINENGKVLFALDFEIGDKYWLFDDIIIVSKDEKYGIVDWKGKIKADFIFAEIKPDKNSLDFIPVKFIDYWGFVTKQGKFINMQIKDPSEADEKCSMV